MSIVWLVAASATDDTNRPLAIATVVISTVLIVGAIVYIASRRPAGTPTDENLLKALDTVEWYADDVGEELLAADFGERSQIVADASKRIGAAHADLISHAAEVDNRNWEQLVVELTNTESAYSTFAQSDPGDHGAVAQHQHVLTEKVEQFRAGLG